MVRFSLFLLLVFLFAGCSQKVVLPDATVQKEVDNIKSKINIYPENSVPYQAIANKSITEVEEGEENLYGIMVTPLLKQVYDGYLNGDGIKALKAIEKISQQSKDPKMLWQTSFLKVQTLIMMGLGDDALNETKRCMALEEKSFGGNLNCTALRGELYVWLEEYDKAKHDAFNVLGTIGKWEFPTSYPAPPSNMDKLVSVTTAQMRSYVTLAALYNLTENYKESYFWANEGEKRMNAVHYVSNHWLYGKFVHLHLDSYYGRATNLVFLATAKLALGYNKKEIKEDFVRAKVFYEMIGYKKGIATLLALEARVYSRIGQYNMAYEKAKQAIEYALENDFLDFIWRIEAIKAEIFKKLGRVDEARKAYRRANDTISILTGALSFESAKRSFGIGKDDISYHLIKYDIEDNNMKQLFIDLETSRARAFVDMLGIKNVELHKDNKLLQEIRILDKKIKKQHLLNTAIVANKKNKIALKKLLKERVQKAHKLYKQNPNLSSAIAVWSYSLQNTQKNLQPNEQIIYFLPLHKDENVQYLSITHNKTKRYTLDISYEQLADKLQQLTSLLGMSDNERGLKIKKSNIVTLKTIPSKSKLENGIEQLKVVLKVKKLFSKEKNYIVASGVIHFVPWGMLEQEALFSELPNGNWLNHKSLHLQTAKKAVIVANPDFNHKLPQLQGAKEEGMVLEKIYKTQLIYGKNATKKHLLDDTKNGVGILHLATHGIFYENKPLQSAIFLANAVPLNAREIYKHPLLADTVVLSACETGLGKTTSSEEFLGLNRSLFLGGTKTILSSLWAIDDTGTKRFMEIFHTYAKDKRYMLGYQQARKILKKEGYSPAVYGAFVLNGADGE